VRPRAYKGAAGAGPGVRHVDGPVGRPPGLGARGPQSEWGPPAEALDPEPSAGTGWLDTPSSSHRPARLLIPRR
jgi:hypothetical protein